MSELFNALAGCYAIITAVYPTLTGFFFPASE